MGKGEGGGGGEVGLEEEEVGTYNHNILAKKM